MDVSMLAALISSWITHSFPSLEQYTKYVAPSLFIVFTVFGIFTNVIPEPNHKYPVPDVSQLEAELQGNASFVLRMAKFTRSMVISMNWFISTIAYAWFYTTVKKMATFVPKLKKTSAK